ncbi:MAG: hypothetical protein IK144_11965 [Bacteroidaceae bacterium]|nr:hypothetical protein [Bacteroidaceae bacterium]
MEFAINYNNGYEVAVLMEDARGLRRWLPLRNFGDRQGDAKCFKYYDCPKLTDAQLRMLIKRFDRNVKYERINGRRFVKQNK